MDEVNGSEINAANGSRLRTIARSRSAMTSQYGIDPTKIERARYDGGPATMSRSASTYRRNGKLRAGPVCNASSTGVIRAIESGDPTAKNCGSNKPPALIGQIWIDIYRIVATLWSTGRLFSRCSGSNAHLIGKITSLSTE
jgi:hypothetical protein